jgi:hypothetical protein
VNVSTEPGQWVYRVTTQNVGVDTRFEAATLG